MELEVLEDRANAELTGCAINPMSGIEVGKCCSLEIIRYFHLIHEVLSSKGGNMPVKR